MPVFAPYSFALACAAMLVTHSAFGDEKSDHFEAKIRPALAKHCFRCHGPARKGGLRVDSRGGLIRGGRTGPAIVPGKPDKSLLIQAVRRKHAKFKMPPGKALPAHVVTDLERWIAEGAVWTEVSTEKYAKYSIGKNAREFWSFQPVRRPTVPVVSRKDWNKNPIDAFVLSRLQKKELVVGQLADKRTLIRRATFDLVGLPPTIEEVENFLRDDSPKAFETVIERLLASQQYGERWGRHWLDLVRYADTAGDAADFPVPEAYKYRNYVIDAFNGDKPYNEFIREQIAGDLLPAMNDPQRWEQVIATGYLAISRRIGVSPQNLRHITIENTIDNLGKTFLGLTLGCARCHEHKFDPIPTEDYYALYGIFDSSIYPHAGAEHKPHRVDFVYRVGAGKAAEILKSHRKVLDEWNSKERAQLEVYREFQRRKVTDPNVTRESTWKDLLRLREQRAVYARTFPDLEIAYAIQEGEPHDVHVMEVGDPSPRARGSLVRRGFPKVLGGMTLPDNARDSGRLELAGWVADPRNPLAARVMVNRIWHHHFGQGLVKSTSDFGVRGTPPTHPALLDFLATRFVEQGWSIKQMHRLLMQSRTYRLSSANIPSNSSIDPQNELLWRANRLRLDADQIRDSLLMFSGRLDTSMGERHPFPHRLTYFYRQHEPFAETFSTRRRSVYMMQQRIQKNPFLDLFDGPDGNLHVGERKASTTTLQALFLMNSQFVRENSEAMARRVLDQKGDTATRVNSAYAIVFGRPVAANEMMRADRFLTRVRKQLAAAGHSATEAKPLAWASYLRGMTASNEFLFVD